MLVVDDCEDLRELFAEILEGAGYRVFSAANGIAALALAKDHPGEIDVLLSDIVMPMMLGSELAAKLQAENPTLRVLFMSGYARPAIGAAGGLGPESTLLQKPFMASELLETLAEILAAPLSNTP